MSEVRNHYEEKAMQDGWHLDKKITLGLIFSIIVQCIVLFMWGARLDQRVSQVETASANHTVVIEAMRTNQSDTKATLARMDERLASTSDGVKEIKAKLDAAFTTEAPTRNKR